MFKNKKRINIILLVISVIFFLWMIVGNFIEKASMSAQRDVVKSEYYKLDNKKTDLENRLDKLKIKVKESASGVTDSDLQIDADVVNKTFTKALTWSDISTYEKRQKDSKNPKLYAVLGKASKASSQLIMVDGYVKTWSPNGDIKYAGIVSYYLTVDGVKHEKKVLYEYTVSTENGKRLVKDVSQLKELSDSKKG